MSSKVPKIVLDGLTTRQWRRLKRAQFRKVIAAIEEYRYGCTFCPGYGPDVREPGKRGAFQRLEEAAVDLKLRLSPAEWGD